MNEDAFWQLIEESAPIGPDPDAEQLAAALTQRLANAPLPMVIGFAEQLSWMLYRLDREVYGRELPGDAFLYTRCAIVAAGRATYEQILHDPSAFAPYARDLIWAEAVLYVPDRAYSHLTGEQWDRSTRYSFESYSNAEGWPDQASSDAP
ncbi:DUF4240 domain-containing protein [Streptomyces sp. NPDC050738]|uniref:DUF4240 domain-containing protein n=1 Tax=Streptomyces sp. NPDC050738 TaxID=3154744 RepID=UPI00343F1372